MPRLKPLTVVVMTSLTGDSFFLPVAELSFFTFGPGFTSGFLTTAFLGARAWSTPGLGEALAGPNLWWSEAALLLCGTGFTISGPGRKDWPAALVLGRTDSEPSRRGQADMFLPLGLASLVWDRTRRAAGSSGSASGVRGNSSHLCWFSRSLLCGFASCSL